MSSKLGRRDGPWTALANERRAERTSLHVEDYACNASWMMFWSLKLRSSFRQTVVSGKMRASGMRSAACSMSRWMGLTTRGRFWVAAESCGIMPS